MSLNTFWAKIAYLAITNNSANIVTGLNIPFGKISLLGNLIFWGYKNMIGHLAEKRYCVKIDYILDLKGYLGKIGH